MDTIVALSSGSLPAGVAVVRMSGPGVTNTILFILGHLPEPRRATYGTFRAPDGGAIDKGLTLFFPGPASFTGEDCAEFQVHGGRAVVQALLHVITAQPGCRMAEAGEFTRRAFLNGKMDLLGAESTADLINAETEAQRRLALNGPSNATLYSGWREVLVNARALLEAEIDFADEGDVPDDASSPVWNKIDVLVAAMDSHVAAYHKAEMVRDGLDVVLLGAPNSGKSSLLNALVQREAAIVSDEAGTTRDLIEVALDLGGYKVRLTDTAGIRDASGKVERIGIERAVARASVADLVLLLDDGAETVPVPPHGPEMLRIRTKSDLEWRGDNDGQMRLSARTGEGLAELLSMLGQRAEDAAPRRGEHVPWRMRQVKLLRDTTSLLRTAGDYRRQPELAAENLRLATDSLGRITGAVDVEDLLDVIFSQFCVGK